MSSAFGILRKRDPGTLNPFSGVELGTCYRPAFGDVEKDGDLDLVLGDSHGTLLYYENNGNATAPEFIARTGGANPFASVNVDSQSAPALFDADGDGNLNLAVGTANGTIVYYKNTGTAELPVYNLAVSPFAYVDAYANSAPAFGDLNNDGSPELLVGGINAYDQGSCFYYESATSEFVARTGSANPFNEINVGRDGSPAFVDLDGDHDLDLVVGESIYGVLIYLENAGNSTTPVFAQKSGSANPFDGIDVGYWTTPALADIDGDGTLRRCP